MAKQQQQQQQFDENKKMRVAKNCKQKLIFKLSLGINATVYLDISISFAQNTMEAAQFS